MSDLFDLDEITTKNARIKELETLIQKYQSSYYNGEAEISDAEFDKLCAYGQQALSTLSSRDLITFHDGFTYFAKQWDLIH